MSFRKEEYFRIMERKSLVNRETELDLLRIIALLAVISVHCTGMGNTDDMSMSNPAKLILVFFDSIVTWQIPIYVMISGRFFLDPERNVSKDKVLKSIWRIVLAFIFWDIIYQVYYVVSGTYSGLNWKGILSQTLVGPYHFWFLFMIVCLYAITPFLRKIVIDKRLTEYFILLFFAFEFLYGYGNDLPVLGSIISEIVTKTNFHFAIGYSGYYVLGYYLYRHNISKQYEKFFYIIAVILVFITSYATIHRVILDGVNSEVYTGYLKPNIIIIACAIYIFFVKRISKIHFTERITKLITSLSEYSFGVYLIHAMIIEVLGLLGISPVIITPLIMHPLIVVLVFIVANIAVGLFRIIPVIGKRVT